MSPTSLTLLRNWGFLLFGTLALVYAVGTLVRGDQIFSGWNLFWAGLAMNALLVFGYVLAGRRGMMIAWDELTMSVWRRALERGYFITIASAPLLALGLELGAFGTGVAFGALAGIASGLPLVLFAMSDLAERKA